MINFYSILILIVIYIHSRKHSEQDTLQNRLYKLILQVVAISLVLDVLSRFDGNPGTYYSLFNFWGNLLVFMTNLVLPSLWLLYVHCQVMRSEKKTLGLVRPLLALNILNAAFILVSLSQGWVYHIDEGNIYHRGPLFGLSALFIFLVMLSAFVFIIVNRRRIEPRYYFPLVFFAVPPFICIFLQFLFYGTSLMLNGVAFSLLIVYFSIQNRNLYTDYLTGVGNRKRLETLLKRKIASSSGNSTFSAILIDMDNFKCINDNFGHDMGDDALATFVRVLKACLRPDDIVARFGGDEFYILLDISDRDVLKATVSRIQESIRKYNHSGVKPYKLQFSLGYAVYDPGSDMKMDEFQKQLDTLMYLDKRVSRDPFPAGAQEG